MEAEDRKLLYDKISKVRDELRLLTVEGCAHRDTHATSISTLHVRIDNEKRIRESEIREERQERIRDIEAARSARETMWRDWDIKVTQLKMDLDKKMESTRNQILFGITVALLITIIAGKFL